MDVFLQEIQRPVLHLILGQIDAPGGWGDRCLLAIDSEVFFCSLLFVPHKNDSFTD